MSVHVFEGLLVEPVDDLVDRGGFDHSLVIINLILRLRAEFADLVKDLL